MLSSGRRSSSEPAHSEPVPKSQVASAAPGPLWSSLALQIDPADSPLEREADQVAAQVMSAAPPSPPGIQRSNGGVHRKCSECEEEDEEKKAIHRQTDGSSAVPDGHAAAQVRDTASAPGQPLDHATRGYFEPRFGRDFSHVRVHTDMRASDSARALHARAYTAGSHVVFRAGEFAPSTTSGRTLLAHELTHVAQHAGDVIQRAPDETATRSTVPGGGATPGAGKGLDFTFLVPSARFVPDIKKYIDRNLDHEASYEIESLDQLFEILNMQAEGGGERVRRIRIVSHGLKTGEVRLVNPTNPKKLFVTPKDVAEYAKQPRIREIVKKALTPDAVVEFWGCSIGQSQAAGEAWATLFGTTFRAQTQTFQTGYSRFLRPAKKGEKGQADPRGPGEWVVMRHRNEINDATQAKLRLDFLNWLLEQYEELARNGDIDPVPPTGTFKGDIDNRLKYMTDLFNRSNGDLRNIEITRKGAKKYAPIRPGDGDAWNALWRTFAPQPVDVITEHPEAVPVAPDIPTDIPVREPENWPEMPVPESAPTSTPANVAPVTEPVRVDPLLGCQRAETTPVGSVYGRVPFATDSSVIPQTERDLERFTSLLGPSLQTTPVRIDGYASTDGPSDYNLGLACQRALAVSEALVVRLGIPPANITTYAHDETSEFSPGDRAANRIALASATPAVAGPAPHGADSKTSHLGPHLLATGADAARKVARLLPIVEEIKVSTWLGEVKMVPGSIWDNDKMLVWPTTMTTYYVQGDRLYEISTGLFLRTYWIDAFAKGVKRAEWLVPIAKIEMAFLTGLLVPWQILLAVAIIDTALTYVAHKETFHRAFKIAWRVLGELYELYRVNPAYFNHLAWLMTKRLGSLAWENAGDLMSKFAGGINGEDVAFFLGRFLKNGYEASARTIGSLIWIASYTAVLVIATHAHHIALHAIEGTAEEQVTKLREAMRAEGVTLTQEEARVLLREFQAHPDAAQRLKVLEAALSELPPALLALEKTLAKER